MTTDVGLECPACGKPGFVRLHNDNEIFECVYCKHKVDLAQPISKSPMGWLSALIVAVLLALLLVGG
jgi:ribosomal protein L37AE/L43A